MNHENLCYKAIEIVREASQIISSNYRLIKKDEIDFKGRNDLVSFVDVQTEAFLINKLSELLPGSGFLAEEMSAGKIVFPHNEFVWIIDPLDGTTNYLHQIPVFSISVALVSGNEILIGIVYEVNRDEMFYCWKNGKAYLNNQLICVSPSVNLLDSLIATGFPFNDFEMIERYSEIFNQLMRTTRGIRRLGSAAVDLAYVACGRFEGFFEFNLKPWDVAAGAFIVELAGGKVSDFNGKPDYLFGKQILASNPEIHKLMLEIIRNSTK